ncbi:DDB1- and CUL4-associated factor 8-like isoform X1 [Tigriopus californicus]|uniref:DDB1- and CUL4-associated factor 8-like isoform X1 n=1 Tax=Tigriopus californicus TaxID=6832 RepID=UPI0027D9FB2A|nr:DDB1- and CUL4-associated factor 8-like isoform X1 [Tigriopus californicus]
MSTDGDPLPLNSGDSNPLLDTLAPMPLAPDTADPARASEVDSVGVHPNPVSLSGSSISSPASPASSPSDPRVNGGLRRRKIRRRVSSSSSSSVASSSSNRASPTPSSSTSSAEAFADADEDEDRGSIDHQDPPNPRRRLAIEDALNLPVMKKPSHALKARPLRSLMEREMFAKSALFRDQFIGSSSLVERFELSYELSGHMGCVNALDFNETGTRLASGSDDLDVFIWDWERRRPAFSFNSGHRANVFQSKFLLFAGDTHVVTASRDGQVRLAELSATGTCNQTRKLAQHRGPSHKLTLLPSQPHTLLSGGEDGAVIHIDVREPKPGRKLLVQKKNEKMVPIYSIDSNKAQDEIFCTSGRDQYIRLFDRRKPSSALKEFCPHHLNGDSSMKTNVTCAVFSRDGSEVIGSYNDEDIYLFETEHSNRADFVKRYQGHRNSATVKGVKFYGNNDEYVISGSDCGHIFIWSKEQESIVHVIVDADEKGVVNVLEPHPHLPVLATSGLDDEIKIWLPTSKNLVTQETIAKIVIKNLREREDSNTVHEVDGEMLMEIWRQIQRNRAARVRNESFIGKGTLKVPQMTTRMMRMKGREREFNAQLLKSTQDAFHR